MKKIIVVILWVYLLATGHSALSAQKICLGEPIEVDSLITLYRFENDTLFGAPQSFSMAIISLDAIGKIFTTDLAWDDSLLLTTNDFGQSSSAIVALNGGFFNTIKGGSVTFIESEGQFVSQRSYDPVKKRDPNPFNGALIFGWNGELSIEPCKSDSAYLESTNEKAVIVTGPLLLYKGKSQSLPETSFSHNRHPRSCVGITEKELIFLAVDGRADEAAGMSLAELQEIMRKLHCHDAVNLDGGGSTTLWLNTNVIKGIVNHPSDNRTFDHKGERRVANAVVIKRMD